jgi:hypothetical protein
LPSLHQQTQLDYTLLAQDFECSKEWWNYQTGSFQAPSNGNCPICALLTWLTTAAVAAAEETTYVNNNF